MKRIRNRRGQGLVEYLIIVAIMGVASITVVKLISSNLRTQFSNVANALGSRQTQELESKTATERHYQSRDLSNFFSGAVDGNNK